MLAAILLAIAMAVLSSNKSVREPSKDLADVYVLEKNGFYDSLNFLEENAVIPTFKIKVAEATETVPEQIAKYIREQVPEQVCSFSLENFNLEPIGKSQKISGSNVVLTTYGSAELETTQDENTRQAKLFNEFIAPLTKLIVDPRDIKRFKVLPMPKQIEIVNASLENFGVEISSISYDNFWASNKSGRIQQVASFFKEAGIPADSKTVEVFVEEYSKFPITISGSY